ncbi:hypothetical protein DRW07_02265 [Alteromonas sediminis]|uniref:Uncharacterized protein n=1 Tax=Alteromonas sediminis TaxID=2259342 RepID=A0A3N5Y4X2_9ALTE|nr:hypothetical protein [Alteromonas sediminis]RPJ68253.1 hypothetical protein DRW07_02265 [Alteromonas sediminis]
MDLKPLLLVFAVFCISSTSYAEIDSPDALYLVSSKGISEVVVKGNKDEHGNYYVNIFVVESIYPNYYKKGMLLSKGWWSTPTQQFYTEDYQIRPKLPHCNAFGEFSWGFPYEPVQHSIAGKQYFVYQSTGKHTKKRAPQKYCIDERISRSTCRRDRCNKWESPEPGNYLVTSLELAKKLRAQL